MLVYVFLLAFIAAALGLTLFFLKNDRGEKEPVGALWMALGFGFLGCMLAGFLNSLLIPEENISSSAPYATIFFSALMVGFIEESCKFIPLALYIYPKRFFNEHTDGVIYFALAGIGFGLPENILYTIQYGESAGVGRLVLTPFFHASTTAIVGYFLIKGKLAKKSQFQAWMVLLAAMLIHGLYDFGLMSRIPLMVVLSVITSIALTIAVFVLYAKATRKDQELGLSVVGNNAFCRSCGKPNPDHSLYCEQCGKRA